MGIRVFNCPNEECKKLVVELLQGTAVTLDGRAFLGMEEGASVHLARPRFATRHLTNDIPDHFRKPAEAAAAILDVSPEASAALTRRTLQRVLVEKAGVTSRDLFDQIEEVLPTLPDDLAAQLDGIRAIGNFGAHPIKSTSTGEFVDVAPDEAGWVLDTLDLTLDHYFVKPAERARRIEAINAKLGDAGKPPLR